MALHITYTAADISNSMSFIVFDYTPGKYPDWVYIPTTDEANWRQKM